jgi:hypothetical protein
MGNGVARLIKRAIVVACRQQAKSDADSFLITDETAEVKNRKASCEVLLSRR